MTARVRIGLLFAALAAGAAALVFAWFPPAPRDTVPQFRSPQEARRLAELISDVYTHGGVPAVADVIMHDPSFTAPPPPFTRGTVIAVFVLIGVLAAAISLSILGPLHRMGERVAQLETSRHAFLSDVAHNLGTPLAAVMGWTDVLLATSSQENGERAQLIRRIQRDVHYVSRTVKQLLALSRWEGRPPELHLETFPFVEPLMEAAESLEDAAAESGTELSLEGLDPRLAVRADRARVRELLQTLLQNVIDHAGGGARAIISMAADDERVWVTIEDDGQSADAHLGLRADHEVSSRAGGARLGVSMAARLVEAHGGTLRVEPRPGGGTRIGLDLPRA